MGLTPNHVVSRPVTPEADLDLDAIRYLRAEVYRLVVSSEHPAAPVPGEGSVEVSSPGRALVLDAIEVLDQLADAVIVADAEGIIRMANQAAGILFRYLPGELVGKSLSLLVPAWRRTAHQAGFDRFVATGQGRLIGGPPMRVSGLRADGAEVPVELSLRALAVGGEIGSPVVATLRDVSERVVLEREALLSRFLQASVDASRDGVLAVSPERRVLAVNRRFCALWGLAPDSVLPGQLSPALGQETIAQVVDPAAFEAAIRWGHSHPAEAQVLDVELSDGRVLEGYAAPIIDDRGSYHGRVWYLHDDTERRRAEARLAAAERAQRFLLDASSALARASGFSETIESLAWAAVPVLGDLCLIDVIDDRGTVERMAVAHADRARQESANRLRQFPPDPAGTHPAAVAMRERTSQFAAEMSDAFLRSTTRDEAHLEIAEQLGLSSYMTVPLIADRRVLGAVTVISAGSGRSYGADDLALAEDLAGRVAIVVAKERRYESQRSLSHSLQASLLPADPPNVPGLNAAVRYLPGTGDVDVGGDFWDVTVLTTGEIALAVGDVNGHDMIAAASMAQLRTAARALRTQSSGPDHLIRLIRASWDQLGLERMATALFARLDPHSGALMLASAGHPPPLMVQAGKAWYLAVEPGPPFGAPCDSSPPLARFTWPLGAAVVFFTDGLVEDRHLPIHEGMNRLLEIAGQAPSLEPETLADHILARLAGDSRSDDVALLVVRRIPASPPPGSAPPRQEHEVAPTGTPRRAAQP